MKMPSMSGQETVFDPENTTFPTPVPVDEKQGSNPVVSEILQWAYVPGYCGVIRISRARNSENEPWVYDCIWSTCDTVYPGWESSSLILVVKGLLDWVAQLNLNAKLKPLGDLLSYPFSVKHEGEKIEVMRVAGEEGSASIHAYEIPVGTHLGNEPHVCWFFKKVLGEDAIDDKGYLTRNELPWYQRENRLPESSKECILQLMVLKEDGQGDGIITVMREASPHAPSGYWYAVNHLNDFCLSFSISPLENSLLEALIRAVSYAGGWDRVVDLPTRDDLGDYPVFYHSEKRNPEKRLIISLRVSDQCYSVNRKMLARDVPVGSLLAYQAPYFFSYWLGEGAVENGRLVRTH